MLTFPQAHVSELAQVIQLSVAPVFLLAGLGAIINAMSTRLARAIDRARALEAELPDATGARVAKLHDELATLSIRARLIGRAIALSVLCALLVTVLITIAFVDALLPADLSIFLGALFIAALVSFSAALVVFLREIFMATASLRIGPH
ncbi:MAG: DUF2721 domain-containing protein [Burkholderiales bacterium]|jgi:hypothetical protein|nr:DUF2721 domain-containing protein [Burkholderiales bacterium]